jgi:hypothetical protein
MATAKQPTLQEGGGERRSNRRYPLESDMAFRIVRLRKVVEIGSGRTVNMSANGVLFQSTHALPVGEDVELSIAWPAQLDNKVRLQLCIIGRTVWSGDNFTAVQIKRYEFRTAGPSGFCQLTTSCQLRACPVGPPLKRSLYPLHLK